MNCFTLNLAPDGLGKLTGYIQEPSPELSNMNRRPALLIFRNIWLLRPFFQSIPPHTLLVHLTPAPAPSLSMRGRKKFKQIIKEPPINGDSFQ